jgi:hypothetical protein
MVPIDQTIRHLAVVIFRVTTIDNSHAALQYLYGNEHSNRSLRLRLSSGRGILDQPCEERDERPKI